MRKGSNNVGEDGRRNGGGVIFNFHIGTQKLRQSPESGHTQKRERGALSSGENTDSGARLPRFKSQGHHLLPIGPWAS